jgi:hypothetical protein
VSPSVPMPVVLVTRRGEQTTPVEKGGTDSGLVPGASGGERGCQAGPCQGAEHGQGSLSSSGGTMEVCSCTQSVIPSLSSHGETLGFHDSSYCGVKINLAERVCGFPWASS